MDGSTSLLDLDFNFMFRVIEFKSGDKDHDFDGTLFQVIVIKSGDKDDVSDGTLFQSDS